MSDQTERPAIMGIDPGLDGAVAVILPAGAEAQVTPAPGPKGSEARGAAGPGAEPPSPGRPLNNKGEGTAQGRPHTAGQRPSNHREGS